MLPEQPFAARITNGKMGRDAFQLLLPCVPDQVFQKQSAHSLCAATAQTLEFGRDNQGDFGRFPSRQFTYRSDSYQEAVQKGALGKDIVPFFVPLPFQPCSRFADLGRKAAPVPPVNRLGIQPVLEFLHLAPVTFFQRHEIQHQAAKNALPGVFAPGVPGFEGLQ